MDQGSLSSCWRLRGAPLPLSCALWRSWRWPTIDTAASTRVTLGHVATLGGVVTLSCPCGRPWRAQERILSPQFIRAVCFFTASVHTCHHEGGVFRWGHEEQGWLDCSWRSWVRQVDRIGGGPQDAAYSQPLRGTSVCGGAPGSWVGASGVPRGQEGPTRRGPSPGDPASLLTRPGTGLGLSEVTIPSCGLGVGWGQGVWTGWSLTGSFL